MTGNDKLSESIIIKLFDQVKDSNLQNTERIKDLTLALNDLTRCIERQPNLNEMCRVSIDSENTLNNLADKVDVVDKKVAKVCMHVKMLFKKINLMVAVVLIVFAVMGTSYIVVRNSIEDMVDRRLDNIESATMNEGKFTGGSDGK